MLLLPLVFILAALDWYAVAQNKVRLGYFTKPAVIVALIAWLWLVGDLPAALAEPNAAPLGWFALGLAFSLVGDVLLMLPRERFMGGLIAFLLAHLAYILGFGFDIRHRLVWAVAILGALVLIVSATAYWRIRAALVASGKDKLQIPVAIYTLAISTMLFAALINLTVTTWDFAWTYVSVGGALLFYLSDLMLAWNRFVEPIPGAHLKVRITYHLGQIGLAVAATMHFSGYL